MSTVRQTRVLLFTATLGYGGSESDLLRLARFLAKRWPVTIALMARDYGSADYSSAQTDTDLNVVVLGDTGQKDPSLIAKAMRWWKMLCGLRELKRRHDVTISFLSGPNLLNALAGRRFPSIVSERGSKLHHVGISPVAKSLWLKVLDPLTYRLAGRIVPASVAYAQEIAAIAGPKLAHKIVPIEGGIDAATLIEKADAPVDADIEAFCAAPTMVYCGRLDRGKGVDLLLPVYARIRQQYPDARFLIIGDGPLRSTLVDSCRVAGLSMTERGDPLADVFMAGYRSDPIRHFRLCQLFCFPSQHEGLPNTLIEGLASGIPVLAADCPYGPRSILAGNDEPPVRSGTLPLVMKHGTLLPLLNAPGSADVWQAAIAAEFDRPARRRSAAECLEAVSRFDLELTGKTWITLIEQLVREQQEGDRQ